MRKIKFLFIFFTSTFLLMSLSGQSIAKVYVCKEEDCDKNKWALITDAQKLVKPSDKKYSVTVEQALQGSESNLIWKSLGDNALTDIYLKYNLWHPGGSIPPGANTDLHLTAYVYSSINNKILKGTCHIFPVVKKGYYMTTC